MRNYDGGPMFEQFDRPATRSILSAGQNLQLYVNILTLGVLFHYIDIVSR